MATWLYLTLSFSYKSWALEFNGDPWFGLLSNPYNPTIISHNVFLFVYYLYIFGPSLSAFFKKLTHIEPLWKLIFGWKTFVKKQQDGGEFG